jgi:hypothetical protein
LDAYLRASSLYAGQYNICITIDYQALNRPSHTIIGSKLVEGALGLSTAVYNFHPHPAEASIDFQYGW